MMAANWRPRFCSAAPRKQASIQMTQTLHPSSSQRRKMAASQMLAANRILVAGQT
jgi:hypothetical protein